jgi:hypothetical protein
MWMHGEPLSSVANGQSIPTASQRLCGCTASRSRAWPTARA